MSVSRRTKRKRVSNLIVSQKFPPHDASSLNVARARYEEQLGNFNVFLVEHTYHRTGRGAACSTIVVASRVLHGGDPQLFVNTWTQVRIEETIGISEINASVELSPYENCSANTSSRSTLYWSNC